MKKKIKTHEYTIKDPNKVAEAISKLIGSDYIYEYRWKDKVRINPDVTLRNVEADIQYLRGVADTLPQPDRMNRISEMLVGVDQMLQSIGYEISDDEIKNSEA